MKIILIGKVPTTEEENNIFEQYDIVKDQIRKIQERNNKEVDILTPADYIKEHSMEGKTKIDYYFDLKNYIYNEINHCDNVILMDNWTEEYCQPQWILFAQSCFKNFYTLNQYEKKIFN